MKKIYSLMLTLLLSVNIYAQWPANYGGVMLQAFYWDSYEDTKWTNLTAQADELSKYFDLLWVPNSSNCVAANSMGYLPVYWFDQRSSFGGRERYLREMIAAYKERGTKIIEDVIFNHKAPVGKDGSWIDFANETWTWEGTTYEINWTGADICQDDDGGYTKSQGWNVTGANDTGDDFSGGRDLDHTSANVQKNCKLFLDYLLKDLGYAGFRLDMVKGYGAQFTKMYNESAKPEFCVGEYWDGKDAITNWINGTGKTSAAFDFPFKYQMNKAFGSGDWSALDWKGIAEDTYWQQYAVTFIDNHDTYENESRLVGNVLGANAFMLAMPGTPCVFLKHWQRYPIAIGNMILARKAAGITNQSAIAEQRGTGSGYILKTQGSKGSVLLLCGNASYDTNGYTLITNSNNIRFYVSSNVTVEGLTPGSDDTEESELTVYVEAKTAPYLYAWAGTGTTLNGDWPGTQMTETATIGEKTFWKKTFSVAPINIIFNNGKSGDTNKTADITGLSHDSYFTYNGTSGYTDITDQYYTSDVELPACAKAIEGHLYAYFQANKDYDMPYAWVWGASDKNFCTNSSWPGDKMKWVGTDSQNHAVWLWDGGEMPEDMPTNLLFSNKGAPQTANFKFVNGGYYDASGLVGRVETQGIEDIKDERLKMKDSAVYDMQGRRVSAEAKSSRFNSSLKPGLYIQNGKKYLVK